MDKKIEHKNRPWKRLGIAAIGLALLAWLSYTIYQNSGTSRLKVSSERVFLDTVQLRGFQEYIPVTGIVQPIKTVLVGALEGGRVEEKFVEDGAMLEAGQAIFRLSNPELQMDYLNQEASIVAQINQIRNTSLLMEQQSLNLRETSLSVDYEITLIEKRLKRNRLLFKDGVIAQVELEEMEDEYQHLLRRKELLYLTIRKDSLSSILQQEQMQNSLSLMRRNLDVAKLSLESLVIKAPIKGQVSGLDTELGELIQKNNQICQIDDLQRFKVNIEIDEFFISRVFTGQLASFQFSGETYQTQISKIYPRVNQGRFRADMLFVDKTPPGIRRGQSVSVRLELSAKEEVFLLARGSFFTDTGGKWAYVFDPLSGTAYKRNIRLGRQNPNYYEILDGLQPGEIVLISSYQKFGDNEELILSF